MPGDITDAAFRARLVDATLQRFGRIDILVNNAGAGLYWPPSSALPFGTKSARMFELNFFVFAPGPDPTRPAPDAETGLRAAS